MSGDEPLIIVNGRFRTMDPSRPTAEAAVLERDRIAWIGDRRDAPGGARMIDAGGAVVLPGLIDAHSHLYWMAQDRLQRDLGDPAIASVGALLDAVRDEAARRDAGWVVAIRANEHLLRERRLPTRRQLDAISRDRPIVVKRMCGHACIANSAALAAAGITDRTADPPGGIIERDEDGRPDGILREAAADALLAVVPTPPDDAMMRALDAVAADYLAQGIVGATEAAVGFSCGFEREWRLWTQLRARGPFALRMAFMLRIPPEQAAALGLAPGDIDPDWQVDALKFFADGTFGSHSAALHQPYANAPHRCGLAMAGAEDMAATFDEAARQGWRIAVHAIGDRAIDTVANALARVRADGAALPRPRIEHMALPDSAATARLGRLGAIAVTQAGFLPAMGDAFVRAVGEERAQRLYPARSLLAAGLGLAGSSDAPASPISPFFGIAAAMERRTASGILLGAGERLDAAEALRTYMEGAAEAIGQGERRGQLKIGAAPDLVVIDRDPLSSTPAEIAATEVLMTVVRGTVAYRKNPAF